MMMLVMMVLLMAHSVTCLCDDGDDDVDHCPMCCLMPVLIYCVVLNAGNELRPTRTMMTMTKTGMVLMMGESDDHDDDDDDYDDGGYDDGFRMVFMIFL